MTSGDEPPALTQPCFDALFERSGAGMAITDPSARFHRVNPALCAFLGRSEAELRGRSVADVTHPADLEVTAQAAAILRAGGRVDAEKRYLRPDGTVVWGHVSATRWGSDDGPAWMLAVVQDITSRKQLEARLADREAELAMLFDEAPFGMALNDPVNGRFLRVNRALSELVGYSADELSAMRWIDLVHPTDLADTLTNLDRERSGDAWERDVVRRVLTKDGRTAWLRCKGQVVRDEAGPRYCVGQFVDLTPVRRQEEQRELLAQHLRRTQQTETVGRLAGGIVHDFNNLLAVILNVAELSRMRAPDARTRGHLEQIHSAATRAAALSRKLTTINRPDEAEPTVLEVNVVIEEVRDLLERALGEDVQFTTEIGAPTPAVRVVRLHFEQALLNLVVNARDAMPLGGRLTLRTGEHRSAGGDLPRGDYVFVEVEDTGTGMAADVVEHAFEPFFTTKEAGHGTGLGLSIVRHAVATAGGHVRVRSTVGKGTSFQLYFPAVAPVEGGDASVAAPVARGHGERVLVVEDELTLLDLSVQLLADHGYVPLAAPGAEPAMELLRAMRRIDLVLTDIVMPGISGTELAARLRETHPDARILFMSGHADDRVAPHKRVEGPVLRKPFTAAELLAAVRKSLDGAP